MGLQRRIKYQKCEIVWDSMTDWEVVRKEKQMGRWNERRRSGRKHRFGRQDDNQRGRRCERETTLEIVFFWFFLIPSFCFLPFLWGALCLAAWLALQTLHIKAVLIISDRVTFSPPIALPSSSSPSFAQSLSTVTPQLSSPHIFLSLVVASVTGTVLLKHLNTID